MLQATFQQALRGKGINDMPSNRTNDPWSTLVARARGVHQGTGDAEVPFGFSTRVVAIAFGTPPNALYFAERYAGRALAIAWILAACSIALNYDEIVNFIASRCP